MRTLTTEQMETALLAVTTNLTKEEVIHELVQVIRPQELKQLLIEIINYEPPIDEKVSEYISNGAISELKQLKRTNVETNRRTDNILNDLSRQLTSTTELNKQQLND